MKTKFTNSLSAFVPAAKRDAANATLNAAGFGPNNFSVPMKTAAGNVTKYGLHAYDDGGLLAALQGITGVVFKSTSRGNAKGKANFDAEAKRLKVGRK